MQYKKIDPATLRLEYACPFCLSAKFAESANLRGHIAAACQAAAAFLEPAELAGTDLQIGEDITLNEYIADEEAYYKYMVIFASADTLAALTDRSADDVLLAICDALETAGHPEKNRQIAGWRIMATFFQLEDEVMERYLQIIYGAEDEDSEEEARFVHPAPHSTAPASTQVIVNKIE
jgi:hypothetical protein